MIMESIDKDETMKQVAAGCLAGSESGSMTFPQVVAALSRAGFESYALDFLRGAATYYDPGGQSVELPHGVDTAVAPALDAVALKAAIGGAQRNDLGYSYAGFCRKAALAGCAGYIVSFPGRRVVYFGRTAETHVEHFPD